MLNRFAQALLVATSLAPVVVVYAVSRLPEHGWDGARWLAVAALLVAACLSLIRVAATRLERESVEVDAAKSMDRDVLSFLVSYALPLIWPQQEKGSLVALGVFVGLVAVLLYQTGLVNVNPLLGLVGYRFFEIHPTTGETVVLVSRRRAAIIGRKSVVRLSNNVWLEVSP